MLCLCFSRASNNSSKLFWDDYPRVFSDAPLHQKRIRPYQSSTLSSTEKANLYSGGAYLGIMFLRIIDMYAFVNVCMYAHVFHVCRRSSCMYVCACVCCRRMFDNMLAGC